MTFDWTLHFNVAAELWFVIAWLGSGLLMTAHWLYRDIRKDEEIRLDTLTFIPVILIGGLALLLSVAIVSIHESLRLRYKWSYVTIWRKKRCLK